MDQEAFSKYLTERYEDQIGWYDKKAADNQRIYRRLQWSVIVLAAITPVLIALDMDERLIEGLGYVPTVTSAIVAILTAGLSTFKYQEHWINYRTTCETLRKEKNYYDAGLGDYRTTTDREALFIDRVESLISRENTMWVSTHKTETKLEEQGNTSGA